MTKIAMLRCCHAAEGKNSDKISFFFSIADHMCDRLAGDKTLYALCQSQRRLAIARRNLGKLLLQHTSKSEKQQMVKIIITASDERLGKLETKSEFSTFVFQPFFPLADSAQGVKSCVQQLSDSI